MEGAATASISNHSRRQVTATFAASERRRPPPPSCGWSPSPAARGRIGARHRDTGGFLLTETLATFTISAFVLLGLVSASSVLLNAVDRGVAHVQDVDDLARTMDAIRRDVSALSRARWNGLEPQPFVFKGGPNSLFFALARRNPDGTRDTSVIALREIVAGAGTRLMRGEAHLSARATSFGDLRFGPQRELGTGPARLRFSYVAASGQNGESQRARDWPIGVALPAAIIVEAVERDTGHLIVSTRVSINANADIGCMNPDGDGQPGPGAAPTAQGAPQPTDASTSTVAPLGVPAQGDTPAAAPRAPDAQSDGEGFCGRTDQDQNKDKQAQNAAGQPPGPAQPPAGPQP